MTSITKNNKKSRKLADETVTQQAKRAKTEESPAMDVDEDYSEIVTDPTFLQNVIENLPGVDAKQNENDNKNDVQKK